MSIPEAPQQQLPTYSAPTEYAAPVRNPGKGLGIAGFVLCFVSLGLVGLILSIIGLAKSRKAGQKNGFAVAGIVLGALSVVGGIVVIVVAFNLYAQCTDLGAGQHVINGVTVTCS